VAFGQPSLKGRALRLLSQREYSCRELATKLARHIGDAEVADGLAQIDRTVAELASLGFVSDQRAADSVLHTKGQRYGLLKIRQVLQAKGIAADLLSDTLDRARATEFDAAKQVWERRFGTPAADAKEHARQYRFLTSRGFSSDTVRRLLNTRSEP
jgi:regulatory protein